MFRSMAMHDISRQPFARSNKEKDIFYLDWNIYVIFSLCNHFCVSITTLEWFNTLFLNQLLSARTHSRISIFTLCVMLPWRSIGWRRSRRHEAHALLNLIWAQVIVFCTIEKKTNKNNWFLRYWNLGNIFYGLRLESQKEVVRSLVLVFFCRLCLKTWKSDE